MTRSPAILISESEPGEARDRRRAATGRSNGETFAALLRRLVPDATCELVQSVEPGPERHPERALADYDAVVLAGSPLHIYAGSPEAMRQIEFMRAVYASGTPCFGSCAGLQIAVVAAGGTVRRSETGHEVAFARRIVPSREGRDHAMMRGRPAAFDALAIHSDEVATLPPDATVLASNGPVAVQAAEIRCRGGLFWGVQYHPEMPVCEIADALRRQSGAMVESGFAQDKAEIGTYADLLDALDREPGRRDLAWRLGIDRQVTDAALRQTEIRNFIDHLVMPTRSRRGRG